MFERNTVNVISADTGAGKTWLALWLLVAAITEALWLGRTVTARRVLVCDEENPQRVVRSRLRALGMSDAHRDRVRYYSRVGTQIGDPKWTRWLTERIAEFGPDLVIVDTASAATNVADVNDNGAVVALYRSLRAIAEQFGLAVVLIHHDRKTQPGQSRAPGQSMMGARQWAGQADAHLSLRLISSTYDEDADGEGTQALATTVHLDMPKLRDGVPPKREEVVISSIKQSNGVLLSAAVVSNGPVESRKASSADTLLEEVVAYLKTVTSARQGAIADAVGEDPKSGTLRKALKAGLESGALNQDGKGKPYRLATHVEGPAI